jgi:hypothetical protein
MVLTRLSTNGMLELDADAFRTDPEAYDDKRRGTKKGSTQKL